MNDNEKNKTVEALELKMENEELGRPEPPIEIDPADIVPVDKNTGDGFPHKQPEPEAGGKTSTEDGPEFMLDQSDIK